VAPDTWAVAVRQPDRSIWVETHPVSDFPSRRRWLKKPMVRGVYALVDSLAIGTKALGIAVKRLRDGGRARRSSGPAR
jgi:uncharacterized protein YqhQ